MIEYIAPMDTSELASGDNIARQKARAAFLFFIDKKEFFT